MRQCNSAVRYQELIDQMLLGVLKSGYGSGVAPPDDDDDDARVEVPSSDVTGADDELLEDDELPDGMRWIDGKDGEWVDGKLVRSTADVSEDLTLHRHPPRPTEQEASSGEPLRVEALNINIDA